MMETMMREGFLILAETFGLKGDQARMVADLVLLSTLSGVGFAFGIFLHALIMG